jgi:hypothetical protein
MLSPRSGARSVRRDRLLAADLLQRQRASPELVAGVVKLLEVGEAVAAIAAHLASLAHIAELPPSPPCR